MQTDIKEQLNQLKDEIDKIFISSEVIENYNKLTCDKLDELNKLDITKKHDELLIQLYGLKHNSECYISLNYSISQELIKINNSVSLLNSKINDLLKACKNDSQE